MKNGQDNSRTPEQAEEQPVEETQEQDAPAGDQQAEAAPGAGAESTGQAGAEQAASLRTYLEGHGVHWDTAVHIVYALIVAALVGVVAVVAAVYRSHAANKVNEASRRLVQASTSSALGEVLDRYSTPKTRPLALLRLAQAQYSEGNHALAMTTYDRFLKEYFDHSLADVAELGRVVCMESQGRLEEALKGYEDFLAKRPKDFLAPDATFGKARCHEQMGRYEAAKQVYEEFLAANEDSIWAGRAEQALENMKIKIKRGGPPVVQRAPAGINAAGSDPLLLRQPYGPLRSSVPAP